MNFIFKNRTIFWDILKWNRGQTKWDEGSNKCKLLSFTQKIEEPLTRVLKG